MFRTSVGTRMQAVPEDYLVVFPNSIRTIYQILVWPIVVIGVIGNAAVLFRILFIVDSKNSTIKPFYRSSLLSLAFSDLLLLGISGVNVLSFVGSSTILWHLPEWSCTIVPYLQTVAVLIASLTLAGVAIDRYVAMRSKSPMFKGLNWASAVCFVAGIWTVAAAASYPILGIYNTEKLVVIDDSGYYVGALCMPQRAEAATAFTILFAVIFAPLAGVFVVVHVLLALSIWQRNCPGDNTTQMASSSGSQFSNENSTASTGLGKPRVVVARRTGPLPSHVARKRRTVRVILVLIIVFLICRLPHWCFLLCKLYVTLSGNIYWHVQVLLTTLSLVNAASHPFLYAFLNEALSLVTFFRARCVDNRIDKPSMRPNVDEKSTVTSRSKVVLPRGPYRTP